jgi:hypothetical protein
MKDKLSALVRNTTATKEHMSKTKHSIWTIKECTRGDCGNSPVQAHPAMAEDRVHLLCSVLAECVSS